MKVLRGRHGGITRETNEIHFGFKCLGPVSQRRHVPYSTARDRGCLWREDPRGPRGEIQAHDEEMDDEEGRRGDLGRFRK